MTRHTPHRPVLLEETLQWLSVGPDSLVLDGTIGDGGHAAAILDRSSPTGRLIGLDLDDEALQEAAGRLRPYGERVRLIRSSFRRLGNVLKELGEPQLDAVLLDLGVSSRHLDDPKRGFRFAQESADVTPLDMRMDQSAGESAAELLARASVEELAGIFRRGELSGAGRVARAIADARREAPLRTAADLRRIIEASGVGRGRKHNPATLVFQALRIAVNDEIAALDEALQASIDSLRAGGRLVVISYHSLEDRLVKNALRDAARGCTCPPDFPQCVCGGTPSVRVLTRRPVKPTDEEIASNPRARSARLRACEKLEAA